MMTREAEMKRAVQLVAENALAHPTWTLDDHDQALSDVEMPVGVRHKFTHAIVEAIDYSRTLVREQAISDGWTEIINNRGRREFWSPEGTVCVSLEELCAAWEATRVTS